MRIYQDLIPLKNNINIRNKFYYEIVEHIVQVFLIIFRNFSNSYRVNMINCFPNVLYIVNREYFNTL